MWGGTARGQEYPRPKRCARKIDQLPSLGIFEPAQLHICDDRAKRCDLEAGPVGDVGDRRRPEAAQVAARQVFDPRTLVVLIGADPVLGERVEVGSPFGPGSGGRHPNQVDPQSGARPGDAGKTVALEQRGELSLLSGTIGEVFADASRHGRHIEVAGVSAVIGEPCFSAALPRGGGEELVIGHGGHMDRDAHHRRLDDPTLLERLSQRLLSKVPQARPQPDIRRRCVLSLKPPDPLECLVKGQVRPFEKELSSEQGSIQIAFRERSFGHPAVFHDGSFYGRDAWGDGPRVEISCGYTWMPRVLALRATFEIPPTWAFFL